jgi:hypothetical protein
MAITVDEIKNKTEMYPFFEREDAKKSMYENVSLLSSSPLSLQTSAALSKRAYSDYDVPSSPPPPLKPPRVKTRVRFNDRTDESIKDSDDLFARDSIYSVILNV